MEIYQKNINTYNKNQFFIRQKQRKEAGVTVNDYEGLLFI